MCETSGRLDQILANLNTLYKAKDIVGNVPVYQLAKNSLSWLLAAGSHQINVGDATVKKGCWCSLVALGAGVERVTTTGLKWNLGKCNYIKSRSSTLFKVRGVFSDLTVITRDVYVTLRILNLTDGLCHSSEISVAVPYISHRTYCGT